MILDSENVSKIEVTNQKNNNEKTNSQEPKKQPKGKVFINAERCKGCTICVEFCPSKVLTMSKSFNSKGYHPPEVSQPEKCTGCDICGMMCPDFAIFGVKIKDLEKNNN